MKVTCETLTSMYHSVHRVDAVSCRVSWVYGPLATHIWYPVWFLANALAGIPSRLDKGGDFSVDYTYVKDAALGLYLAYAVRPLEHRLFNITSGRKITVTEAAETVRAIARRSDSHRPGTHGGGAGQPEGAPASGGGHVDRTGRWGIGVHDHVA